MKRLMPLSLAAGLVLLVQTAAQAAPINWTYDWSVSPIAVPADVGTGSVSLTNFLNGAGAGNSFIVATNLLANSSADPGTPDLFNNPANTYTLTLTLTDTDSGSSDTFEFSGYFTGDLSNSSANISNTFVGSTNLSKQIGDNHYDVEIGPYVPPGPPSAGGQGAISAFVTVREGDGGGTPNDVPEPTSILLGGFGLSFLGLASWRRKRSAKQAV